MTQIVVTGAAGFIGSNIVKGLNARGITNIIAVDDLTQGDKFLNLNRIQISDYVDANEFYNEFSQDTYPDVKVVFHEGACSDTMEKNGRYMMQNNYSISCQLFEACQQRGVRLLYASSAATYGKSSVFREEPLYECPLNVYGYSKLLFDQHLRHKCGGNDFHRIAANKKSQVVGFRYFNVYGPHEQHKGRMASVAYHHFNQLMSQGHVELFDSYGGFGPGNHLRDFVFVDDVVAVNLWFYDHPDVSGIFNLGSGAAQSFNEIAITMINTVREEKNQNKLTLTEIKHEKLLGYIDFPQTLMGKYQCHTVADLSRLRSVGCNHSFRNVQTGVAEYARWLMLEH